MELSGLNVGFAITGSFCTLEKSFQQLQRLSDKNINITPIISNKVKNCNTRFGNKEKWIKKLKTLCNNEIVDSVIKAEPIGPQKLLDLLIVAPCTGNTMAKIAHGIIDETVVMAVKAQLRNKRPVLLAVATNDGLSLNAESFSKLLNTENIFFVPFGQDNPIDKPNSLVARFDLLQDAAEKALDHKQIQPIIIEYNGFY